MKALGSIIAMIVTVTVSVAQESTAVFIRPDAMLIGALNVIANNEFVGKIKTGDHLALKMQEGSQFIQVRRTGRKAVDRLETVIVTLRPGETHYFLLIELHQPGMPIELVELNEASAMRLLTKQEVQRKSRQMALQ